MIRILRWTSLSRRRVFALTALGGALTGSSLVFPAAWMLVLVGPSLFFAALLSEDPARLRRAAVIGFIFGTTLNAVTGLSAWSVYPLDWVGIHNPGTSLAIIGVFWIGSAMSMAAAFASFALGFQQCRIYSRKVTYLFIYTGVLWVATEWLQAVLSSIYMLGPSTTLNAHFTLASVGNAFAHAHAPLWFSLARWGGVPILSLFVSILGLGLALLARESDNRLTHTRTMMSIVAVFLLLSLSATYAAQTSRENEEVWGDTIKITVVAIRGDFPPEFELNAENTKKKTSVMYEVAKELRARNITPDILIAPEGMGTLLAQDSYREISSLMATGTLLIHSRYPRDSSDKHTAPQTVFHTIGGDSSSVTEKQFLIPYGEYPPYHFSALLRILSPETYSQILHNRSYPSGNRSQLGSFRGIPVGVRMCSEVFSPYLFKDLVGGHSAGILVLTSSIGIFHHQPYLPWQMQTASRLRAVENGLPLVQAMNASEAFAYDCQGREIAPEITTKDYKLYTIYRDQTCPLR